MDANTLVTLLIAGAVIFVFLHDKIKTFFRGAASKAAPQGNETTPITQEAIKAAQAGETPLPLAAVLAHLNNKPDDIPHFFSVGGTGSGKSTFARMILSQRVQRGEQFIIITGKRTSVFDDVPCIGRDAIGADGKAQFETARETFKALSAELARRDNTPIRRRAFTTLNVLIDDATILLAELPEAANFLRVAALLGRELQIRLIVQLGSLRLKELGWEGRGDLREHFAVVTYEKGLSNLHLSVRSNIARIELAS
jgi:DNA helicase HerA-like ATPase